MSKRVLVVGGAGYVGGVVVQLLVELGHTVRVYDALLYEQEIGSELDFVLGDVRDREKLMQHLRWCDVVIWLAAIVGDGACDLNPTIAREVNEGSVVWLSQAFQGRIIFPSTSMAYGVQPGVLTEQALIQPVSLYAQTKWAAEAHLPGKNALILRLGTLFGYAHSRIRFDLVVNLLTMKAITHNSIPINGGEQVRAFLHVVDVARLMAQQVATDSTGVYNLHAENISIRALAERIHSHVPSAQIILRPKNENETGDYTLDSGKAQRELGFVPERTIDDGIQEIQELLRCGKAGDVENPCYNNAAFLRAHPMAAEIV